MIELTIKVHEIAVDGLPPRDDDSYTGRVAFLFDGCIVSGWPLHREDHAALYHPARIEHRAKYSRGGAHLTYPERYRLAEAVLWEANCDVGHGGLFSGVTHWVEFPHPWWDVLN